MPEMGFVVGVYIHKHLCFEALLQTIFNKLIKYNVFHNKGLKSLVQAKPDCEI